MNEDLKQQYFQFFNYVNLSFIMINGDSMFSKAF